MAHTDYSVNPGEGGLVRFGLVGCGRIGATSDDRIADWIDAHLWLPYTHAAAISSCEEASLVAVCDQDEARAAAAREAYQVPSLYTDFREMIERERIDAIAIATRTAERAEIIRHSVAHGVKAIYCEKPLSNSLEVADELRSLVERGKVFFVYGTRRRFMPTYQQVRDKIAAGEIGELQTIVVRFGTGSLFWGHPHSVDIACFFAGDAPVDSVQADLEFDLGRVKDNVVDADPIVRMGYIKFKTGVTAHIIASDSYDVELSGSKGQVVVRSDGRAVHWRHRLPGDQDYGLLLSERSEPANTKSSGARNSIKALTRALKNGTPPGYDVSLAVQNQEILFGFVYSHLNAGAQVSFPLERRNLIITGRTGEMFA